MPAFFSKPSYTSIHHELTLIDYQTKKIKFNPKDVQHTKLVSDCVQSVKDNLANLQMTDIKMTSGFALGTAAFLLSYILPFSVVATVAFSYAAYQLAKRQQAYLEYTYALENLAKCCAWSLGEVSNLEIKDNPVIQEMIDTLAPLTSTQQLRDFIDERVEEEFINQAEKAKENITIFDEQLDKEKATLYFKIYGYKQGGFLAILEGLGYAVRTGYNSLSSYVTPMFSSHSPT